MDDLISRQAVINAINDMIETIDVDFPLLDFNSRYMMERGMRMTIIQIKNEIPNAEPERKKGKWLLFDGYRCSECNYKLQTTGIPSSCPNCGADMRGE